MLTRIRSSMACSSLVLVGVLAGACVEEGSSDSGDPTGADEGTTTAPAEDSSTLSVSS